jgi:hypothetical protein
MALAHFIGEIAFYDSLLFNRTAVAEWGLLTIAIATLTVLFFILKRRKWAKEVSVLIHHNRQKDMLQKKSKNWEKGKKRIEKLLYEMTDHIQPGEFLNPQSGLTNTNKRNYYDIPVYGRTNKILRERNLKVNRPKDSGTPLDVQELMTVSTLAKQLRARSQHNIRF